MNGNSFDDLTRSLKRRSKSLCPFFVVLAIGLAALGAEDPGPTVRVNVVAVDSSGNPLTYHWRATDGQIHDVNAPTTAWTLPSGPGNHFAYVLVSNGKGGYTERRMIVNTDDTNTPIPSAGPRELFPQPPKVIPGDPVPFRDWLGGGVAEYLLGGVIPRSFRVALPDIAVRAEVSSPPVNDVTSTSVRGDFTLQKLSPLNPRMPQMFSMAACNLPDGSPRFQQCFGNVNEKGEQDEVVDVEANQTNRVNLLPHGDMFSAHAGITWITGRVLLADGSPCGTENEFFGVTSTATAELIDTAGHTIPGTLVRANSWGQFSIPQRDPIIHRSVLVRCEGAAPRQTGGGVTRFGPDQSRSFDVGLVTIGARPPQVTGMSPTLPLPPGIRANFDPPPTGLPSDVVPLRPARFLAMKGLDTRASACAYYLAIGAVRACDSQGNFSHAISFDDWKRTVKIDQFAGPQAEQFHAVFVNVTDLNLTRRHEMISHGRQQTAGYVCNHAGPPNPNSIADVNRAIENAAAGKNLAACVAMDFSISPRINDNQPFTRFLIFGPSGELLPSVNLDGLGEKFVPGTCIVCHGGNRYAGRFPADGTGRANVEGHFLPFDVQSFRFHSSRSDLTQEAQEAAIFGLNQDVLRTNKTEAEAELINGWYKNGTVKKQITDFVPPGLPNNFKNFYLGVIARSCRTCHIAQRDQAAIKDLNFSRPGVNLNAGKLGRLNPSDVAEVVCGEGDDLLRAYAMPNSLVTFNQFWQSRDQRKLLQNQLGTSLLPNGCFNPAAPKID